MSDGISFGERLASAVLSKSSAVCVGLDPRWASLPETMTSGVDAGDLTAVANVTSGYCKEVIDAVAPFTPIVKPQAAFFEQLGPAGMQALYDVIAYAQQAGILVLLDAKRGDIGSTAAGYAEAYLGQSSAWGCDALTVNPYLGDDTLVPFFDKCVESHAGIFVLVKTSNPGSGFLQDCKTGDSLIYERVAEHVQSLALSTQGESGLGSVGAVVGATYPEQLADLRARMPNTWILIPGFGAQGGTASDVKHGFASNGLGAIVNSSRGIIFAYQNGQDSPTRWQDAVANAAEAMRDQLNAA